MRKYLSILILLLLAFSLMGCMTLSKLHQDKGILGLKGRATAGAIVIYDGPTLADKQARADWKEYFQPYDEFKVKGTHERESIWNDEWNKLFDWWNGLGWAWK